MACQTFSVTVTMGGVDATSRLAGPLTIEHAENASGLADFELIHEGTLPAVGSAVAIQIDDGRGAGPQPAFSGVLTHAIPALDEGMIRCQCSTILQGGIAGLSKAAILALIPGGQWSKYVFDEGTDRWTYAQDVLSTVPGEIHVNRAGALEYSPWAAKAVADINYTDADRLFGGAEWTPVDKAELINRVRLQVNFEHDRRKMRSVHLSWSADNVAVPSGFAGSAVCQYLRFGWQLPQADQVRSAFEGCGWTCGPVTIDPPPQSTAFELKEWVQDGINTYYKRAAVYQCANDSGTTTFPLAMTWAGTEAWGAHAKISTTWDLRVSRLHVVEVTCPASIAVAGERAVEEQYDLESSEVLADPADQSSRAVMVSADRAQTGSPGHVYDPASGSTATLEGGSVLANGDQYYDATSGFAGLAECLSIAIAKADSEIKATHRRNRLTFDVPLDNRVWLDSTIALMGRIAGNGKVAGLRHSIDLSSGEATTRVELAISGLDGQGIDAAVPLPPLAPPVNDPLTPVVAPSLAVYVGGYANSPSSIPDAWQGFFTNTQWWAAGQVPDPDAPQFPEEFRVTSPDIPEADTQPITIQTSHAVTTAVPVDALTLAPVGGC